MKKTLSFPLVILILDILYAIHDINEWYMLKNSDNTAANHVI